MLLLYIVTSLFILPSISTQNYTEFVTEYYRHRNIKALYTFTCNGGSFHVNNIAKSDDVFIILHNKKNYDDDLFIQHLKQSYTSPGVLLDGSCEERERVIDFASKHTLFSSNNKWLILHNDKNTNDTVTKHEDDLLETVQKSIIFNAVNNANLSIDADIVIAVQRDENTVTMFDVFNHGKVQGGEIIVEEKGSWNTVSGFQNDFNKYKYYNRWDFHNLSMRMIVVVSLTSKPFNPQSLRDISPTPGLTGIIHVAALILHELADLHNLRFKYTTTDRWIGSFNLNESRNVGSSIYHKEQDISPVLRHQLYLMDKVDVLNTPLTYIETKYFYRIPTSGPGKFENQFVRPLSFGAWITLIAVSIICACILLMSSILEQRHSKIQYAVFSVFASICQQFFEDSDENNVKRVSEARKLTILVTGIFCVLVYNYYTSSVVSWLLNAPPPSINSLRELLESPLELIYEDIGYTRSWLQTSKYYYNKKNAEIEDEIRRKKVFNKKKGSPLLMPVEEGIALVKAGGYAYHTEGISANRLISRTFTQMELCELGSLQSIEKTDLSSVIQKNSPYKEFLNWSLLRLLERGVVGCIQKRMGSKTSSCEGSTPRALSLGGAAPAFLMLAFGYTLAAFIMVLERLIFRSMNELSKGAKRRR